MTLQHTAIHCNTLQHTATRMVHVFVPMAATLEDVRVVQILRSQMWHTTKHSSTTQQHTNIHIDTDGCYTSLNFSKVSCTKVMLNGIFKCTLIVALYSSFSISTCTCTYLYICSSSIFSKVSCTIVIVHGTFRCTLIVALYLVHLPPPPNQIYSGIWYAF